MANAKPAVNANDHSLHTNQWSQVNSWISYSDADGNRGDSVSVLGQGTGCNSGYFWTPSNPHHAANTPITVSAADLANVWVRGGQCRPAHETMSVRAFDGTDWGAWDSFTLTTTPTRRRSPPSTTTACTPTNGRKSRAGCPTRTPTAMLRRSISSGTSGTGANSGYFWTPSNAHHAANTPITVAAADLANVWVRGGQAGGTETMWVRAFDGTDWSAWDSFTFTTSEHRAGRDHQRPQPAHQRMVASQ